MPATSAVLEQDLSSGGICAGVGWANSFLLFTYRGKEERRQESSQPFLPPWENSNVLFDGTPSVLSIDVAPSLCVIIYRIKIGQLHSHLEEEERDGNGRDVHSAHLCKDYSFAERWLLDKHIPRQR